MAGTWAHACKGGETRVEVRPFSRPGAALRAGIEAEAERLAAFLGAPLALRFA